MSKVTGVVNIDGMPLLINTDSKTIWISDLMTADGKLVNVKAKRVSHNKRTIESAKKHIVNSTKWSLNLILILCLIFLCKK